MRFDITSILMAMATTVVADRLEVYTICNSIGVCDSGGGQFFTDYSVYKVDANAGCRGTSVPGMTEFCMDWGARRGHFRFSHQSNKRCLRQASETKANCGLNTCFVTVWSEVPCTWREIPVPEEELATKSEAAAPAKTADN